MSEELKLVPFTEEEFKWLYEKLTRAARRSTQIKAELGDKQDLGAKETKLLDEASKFGQYFEETSNQMAGMIKTADTAFLNNLVEPGYALKVDTFGIKLMMTLIDRDVDNIKTAIVPAYEKRPEEDFTVEGKSKSYYLDRYKKMKHMLQKLQVKLEDIL